MVSVCTTSLLSQAPSNKVAVLKPTTSRVQSVPAPSSAQPPVAKQPSLSSVAELNESVEASQVRYAVGMGVCVCVGVCVEGVRIHTSCAPLPLALSVLQVKTLQ